MRYALAAAFICLGSMASGAERIPSFPKRTPYFEARESLQALGWSGVHAPQADVCREDDDRCQGRPEMAACSGTGLARCTFLWRKGGTLIEVGTYGEGEPILVDRVTCRVDCGR